MRRLVGACLAMTLAAAFASSATARAVRSQEPDKKGGFTLVGHEPLGNRGMNAALAVHGDYAYVGSRVDGRYENVQGAGVLVVDVSDPSAPAVVHEIGPPDEGNTGETSREMRVWAEQDLLIVMNLYSNCAEIHACTPVGGEDNFRFYDISGKNAAEPKLVAEYLPSSNPHEFFLWDDPKRKGRALLYISTPSGPTSGLVADVSKARSGKVTELGGFATGYGGSLHSYGVSNDGEHGYLSHLTGGVGVIDVHEFSEGAKKPEIRIITPPDNAPKWEGPGAHSTVKVFGRDYMLITDEVYGEALAALGGHGCPWGWMRMVSIANPVKPKVVSEFKLPYNEEDFCTTDPPRPFSSYSAHNPTLTKNLAFISWHSGGLQAISIANPKKPVQVAEFLPEPLLYVVQEDPVLSLGQDKVVVWSYPIIKDGLIYVVDVRNGLYVLEYDGPFANEVTSTDFIEGNSNQGDALRFEKP